ncbi:response regulator [Myxococcota bacterium]|nr:response regulator [Myxococcota bacterium]
MQPPPSLPRGPARLAQILDAYDHLFSQRASGPGLLVDAAHQLVHVIGEGHRYLQIRGGLASLNVLDLIATPLAVPLGGALREALSSLQAVRFGLTLAREPVEVEVWPLSAQGQPLAFIGFHADAPPTLAPPKRLDPMAASRARVAALEDALSEARAQAQAAEAALEEAEAAARRLESQRLEEAQLRARAAQDLADLNEAMSQGVIFLDGLFCVRQFNAAATALFELHPESLSLPLRSVTAKVERGAVTQAIRAVFSQEVPQYEIDLRHDDGRWFRLRVGAQRASDGELDGLVLIFDDVTNQRRQEARAARLAHQGPTPRWAEIFAKLPYGLAYARLEGDDTRLLDVNPAALTLGGVARQAEGPLAVAAPLADQLRAALRDTRGAAWEIEGVEGQPLRARLLPIEAHEGLLIFESLSEAQRQQARLVSAQRMEAVAQLSGGLAHELNNMLSVILMSGELVREELTAATLPLDNVASVLEMSNRAADLISQLLTFSRRRPVKPSVIDLPSFIRAKQPILRGVLGPTLRLSAHTERQPEPIYIDVHALEQALIHLASNARRASPNGGRVEIRLNSAIDPEIEGAMRAGRYARLTFSDEGDGMDEETRRRCMEPFFTRGSRGLGSGLGLAMVEGVVTQAGGWISVKSAVGQGASFSLYLPIATQAHLSEQLDDSDPSTPSSACEALAKTTLQVNPPAFEASALEPPEALLAADEPMSTAPTAPPGPKPAKILLVEDERALRLILTQQINRLGYEVIEASSAEAALSVFSQHPDVDLVLSDVIMPGMNGPTLARRLRALRADLKIVLMSGYTEHAGVQNTVLELGLPFISKPFTRRFLAMTLERTLKGPARPLATPTPEG